MLAENFDDSTEGLDSDLEVAAVLSRGNHEARSFYRSQSTSTRYAGTSTPGRTSSSPGRPVSTPGRPGSTAGRTGFSPYRPSTVMSNAPRNNIMTVTPSVVPTVTIHQVAARGEISYLKQLLKENDVNKPDDLGLTPLMWAAANDQLETVTLLIKSGADCNLCGNDNQTALHLAVNAGFDRMVLYLLENGLSNVNQRTIDGNTALLYAVYGNHVACVKTLLEYGADFLITNCNGNGAADVALTLGNRDIKLMLDAYIVELLESSSNP